MAIRIRKVWLDYRTAGADRKLLSNLSGICWNDPLLWTVSDEHSNALSRTARDSAYTGKSRSM
ncbi:hypothetical protein ACVMHZ_009755 [Bradyrhizobium liaoningense]